MPDCRLPVPGTGLPIDGCGLPAPCGGLPAPGGGLPAPGGALPAPGGGLPAPGGALPMRIFLSTPFKVTDPIGIFQLKHECNPWQPPGCRIRNRESRQCAVRPLRSRNCIQTLAVSRIGIPLTDFFERSRRHMESTTPIHQRGQAPVRQTGTHGRCRFPYGLPKERRNWEGEP